jgi:hypothetical protein
MPEVPNAYKCDFCRTLMEPVEKNDGRWHTKWCSACHAKLYDVRLTDLFAGGGDPDSHDYDD